jgi:hypothetical protein
MDDFSESDWAGLRWDYFFGAVSSLAGQAARLAGQTVAGLEAEARPARRRSRESPRAGRLRASTSRTLTISNITKPWTHTCRRRSPQIRLSLRLPKRGSRKS